MTEAEWLGCTTLKPMAEFLNLPRRDERKQWLLACACCRRIWSLMSDERSRRLLELRERYADGLVSRDELWQALEPAGQARNEARAPFRFLADFNDRSPEAAAAWAAVAASTNSGTAIHFVLKAVACIAGEGWKAAAGKEGAVVCDLLRCVFNPLRPPSLLPPAVLAWNDSTVLRIAQAIYEERELPAGTLDGSRLAVLADALLDAGCEDEALLAHCRSPGPRVRGCWAIDLILGKEEPGPTARAG